MAKVFFPFFLFSLLSIKYLFNRGHVSSRLPAGCGKHRRAPAKSLMDTDAPISPRVKDTVGPGYGFSSGETESWTSSLEGLV